MLSTNRYGLAHGTLAVRPAPPRYPALSAGVHWLETPTKPALLHVPEPLPFRPPALLVALHGAAGVPGDMLALFKKAAYQHGALLLAPNSDDITWDAVGQGAFGEDATSLQHAMATVFDHFPIDADRIALAGFSDGASYALGLGLANGDLFTRVLAYSPGLVPRVHRNGNPRVLISHGRHDTVLPITGTSHRIVPELEDDGYCVTYIEHARGHEVPSSVVTASSELLG
ncbi:alpha/beta hydrolase [Streptomyces sp. NPDC052016]|uniref:alpha/beta hydrolase n=1 Tax=Streptomyces sp. NPDC052016 TaxID=3365680 RepID=UPI0037D1D717